MPIGYYLACLETHRYVWIGTLSDTISAAGVDADLVPVKNSSMKRNTALHRTESRVHPMSNQGIALTFASKKIPLREGYLCSHNLERP